MSTAAKLRDARRRSPCGSVPDYLVVKPSEYLIGLGVKQRVQGLYTTKQLPRGYVIQEYVGVIMTEEEADRMPQSAKDYQVAVSCDPPSNEVKHVIDMSTAASSSAARYANQANVWRDQNAMMQQIQGRVFLVARKTIPKGAEILTHYGDTYCMPA